MKSIRVQLTRRVVLVLALLLGAGLVAIHGLLRETLTDSFDSVLRTRALAVSALTEIEGERMNNDFSPDFLSGYGGSRPRNYFEVWDLSGRVLARSPSLRGADLPVLSGGSPARPALGNLRLPNGRRARGAAFTYAPGPGDSPPPAPGFHPTVRLVVAVDRSDLDETLRAVLASVAGGGILLFAAILAVIPPILRRQLAPLGDFAERTSRIDAGSLSHRFPAEGLPAEVQPVAARLNDLLARLESSFERERRFSADLAHELRTPIAELRTLAECAIKWPEARDPASDRDVLEIAERLEALVARMLQLLRSEDGRLDPRLEPVELAGLAERAWRPFAQRAAARRLEPRFALAPATVRADPALLQSIIGNLYDNAVAYAPAGGEVRVSGEAAGAGYRLQVANSANGLVPADLPHLFDRFWRKESSRTGREHFGLGLSLARTFARAMGWELSAEIDARNLVVFTLSAPGNPAG